MSPASSGGGTAPRNANRPAKFPSNDEYVDMSPRGAMPIPNIPNRNERNVGYRYINQYSTMLQKLSKCEVKARLC